MATDTSTGDPTKATSPLFSVLVVGVGGVIVFFFFDDVLGMINHGGIFSSLSAIGEMKNHARFIDVDSAGFRTFF